MPSSSISVGNFKKSNKDVLTWHHAISTSNYFCKICAWEVFLIGLRRLGLPHHNRKIKISYEIKHWWIMKNVLCNAHVLVYWKHKFKLENCWAYISYAISECWTADTLAWHFLIKPSVEKDAIGTIFGQLYSHIVDSLAYTTIQDHASINFHRI